MLRRLDEKPASVEISKAFYPAPFKAGLEYNPPARGVWNIVHTGMLVPQSHQIFACAQGCLRGVLLTAAEMNAMDRMSWIAVEEEDMFDGTMEQDIIDGTADILKKLPCRPRAVLLFISCIQLFAGCDFEMILSELRAQFPDIDFTDCYMTPTMRKTISPDAKMRMQLYDALRPLPLNKRSVNIIGCDRPLDEDTELLKIIRSNGFTLRDLTLCRTYDEYLEMAESAVNITCMPTAKLSGERLSDRFGAKHLYLPISFDVKTIEENYKLLCDTLDIDIPDFSKDISAAERAMKTAAEKLSGRVIAIDFTVAARPFELAKVLCGYGFKVKYIFADSISEEDKPSFEWLKENFPNIRICSVTGSAMLFTSADESECSKIVAIGQKAAFYCRTDHFVNTVANGGLYGIAGVKKLAELISDAAETPKDRRKVIQHKGIGCPSCL